MEKGVLITMHFGFYRPTHLRIYSVHTLVWHSFGLVSLRTMPVSLIFKHEKYVLVYFGMKTEVFSLCQWYLDER
jgi:hypothetical protein